jgi:hypothetical protein
MTILVSALSGRKLSSGSLRLDRTVTASDHDRERQPPVGGLRRPARAEAAGLGRGRLRVSLMPGRRTRRSQWLTDRVTGTVTVASPPAAQLDVTPAR